MAIVIEIKCEVCRTKMRGRDNEAALSLRERAKHAGWKHNWETNYRDLCQVCASKEAK